MTQQTSSDTEGCCGCVLVLFAVALVVAALISVAAVVDPFDWMPAVGEVWADCESSGDDCDLDERFPGFWGHVIANLAWTLSTALALLVLVATGSDVRETRAARWGSAEAARAYVEARRAMAAAAVVTAALGGLPVVIAVV